MWVSKQLIIYGTMRVTSFQYRVLSLVMVAVALDETVPLVKDSIETLRSIGKIPIYLRFSDVSSSDLHPWILDLPISCLVVRQPCLHSGRGRDASRKRNTRMFVYKCDPRMHVIVDAFHLKNVVLFVLSLPGHALHGLNEYINSHYRVPVLAIPGSEVVGKPVSCFFMSIRENAFDIPLDNCLYSEGWRRTRRLSAATFQVQDKSRFPRNIPLIIAASGYGSVARNLYARYPEAIAYLNALPVLNVTPIFTFRRYREDIIIEPSVMTTDMLELYDVGGVYTCSGYGFFSSKGKSNTFSIISSSSLTVLIAALILVGFIIATSLYMARGVLHHLSCGTSELVLFLVATSVGRSPVPLTATGVPFRAFLVLWLFGTFIVGSYVQTQITSEYNVPAYSPAVETVEDLQMRLTLGTILPCVDEYPLSLILQYYRPGVTEVMGNLNRIMSHDFNSFASPRESCCKRARNGAHVYITSLDFVTRNAAYEWDLCEGKEVLLTHCSVALARKGFRYVQHHRRLVLALAEAGLTLHEERRRTWNRTQESSRTVTFPFSKQFHVLMYGCGASVLILLCELLYNKVV